MMWSWFLKLDPNVIFPVISGVALWIYRKIAGDKAKTVEQIVNGAVDAILSEIADVVPTNVPINTWLQGARQYVMDRIWGVLSIAKIKKTAEMERIVKAALERATSELSKRIAEERRKHVFSGVSTK